MATRGRKYTVAAPAEVRSEVAEQERLAKAPEPTMPERHAQRVDTLRRAGAGMMQNPDRSWRPVALWLSKAIVASSQAWFHGGKVESPVLPGGELDWSCQVAMAYLRYHGEGDPAFRRSDRCPDEFRDRSRGRQREG